LFHNTKVFVYFGILLIISLCWVRDIMADVVIKPSIIISEKYDSNIFFRSRDQGVVSDFLTSAGPQIEIGNEQKGFRLAALYRFNSTYYAKHQEFHLSHNATLTMDKEMSKALLLTVGDSFFYTQDSLEATTTGIQIRRTDITSNTIFINTVYKLTNITSMGVRLSDSILEFEDPTLVDTRTDSAALSGIFMMTANTSATTTYTFTNYSFDRPGSMENVESHSLALGLSHHSSPTLIINLSGGAVYTPSINDSYDWIASAELTKSFQVSSITAGYSRTTSDTSGLTDQLNINETYSLQWNYTLTSSSNISLFGNYIKNYTEPVATVDIISYNAGISGNWRPYSWMTLGLGYIYFQQQAGGSAGADIEREQVFVNISITPVEWRL